jgi:hypothetical protein
MPGLIINNKRLVLFTLFKNIKSIHFIEPFKSMNLKMSIQNVTNFRFMLLHISNHCNIRALHLFLHCQGVINVRIY